LANSNHTKFSLFEIREGAKRIQIKKTLNQGGNLYNLDDNKQVNPVWKGTEK
jgi:hypothetical protein